jgi:iron(III) transport system ATP-binding protein
MLSVNINQFSYLKNETLNQVVFDLKEGSILSVIGESGCGKSTLLKLVYGLHDINNGEIFWKETEVLGPKYNLVPGMEFMKYLAQDFDLMPFITVGENVGKFLSNIDAEKKQNRIDELLNLVEMTEFKNTKAKLLSGGQMQRVALARVLAQEPEVLLLDEPFSHIDNFRKNALRRKIFTYLKQNNITTIIASHDVNDVLSFSDEVMVMQNGKIVEITTPSALYANPKKYYTASLIDDVSEIEINNKSILAFPHQLKISDENDIEVIVVKSYFKGAFYLIEANFDNKSVFFNHNNSLQIGEKIGLKYFPFNSEN